MGEHRKLRIFHRNPYTVLLATLVILLVAWPAIRQSGLTSILGLAVHSLIFLLVLAGAWVAVEHRGGRLLWLGMLTVAFLANLTGSAIEERESTVLGQSVGALLFVYVTWKILGRVLSPGRVTADRIAAALCAYLFVGLLWSNLYWLLWHVHGDRAFAFPLGEEVTQDTFSYFSFVTLTTLGYGEITPVHPLARSLAFVEAIAGQIYIAVVIARLVALEIVHSRTSGEDQSSSS